MIRIIENLLILYYVFYFIIDWMFLVIFMKSVRKENLTIQTDEKFADYPVSIIVPAYNEEVTILHSIQMLLALDYPNFEVIVINDGSSDKTLETVLKNFELNEFEQKKIATTIPTRSVKKIYKKNNLIVIDKENGGKADAINVGINYSNKKLICTIDADSVLDKMALKQTVQPMLDDENVFVSGGQLAVANGVQLKDNKVINSSLPKNIWVQWQIIEYLKSFMIARYSMSKMNAIMIMSGAFSVYRKKDLLVVGGFLTKHNDSEFIKQIGGNGRQTVCEDMEIVVRMWRYFYEKSKKAKAVFLPHPVCWTEVPDNSGFLLKQRNRWHRGLAETLQIHKTMLFEPKYKTIGLFAFPYYLFFELLSPIIKIGTIIFLIIAGLMGYFNQSWILLAVLFSTLASAIITSLVTVYIEQWTLKHKLNSFDALRYKSGMDWIRLILMSILGDFVYAPFRIYAQMIGLKDFINKKNEWYKFSRKGFGESEEK
ncbi:MAG: glycosyltransferase family 2 protein, partial [Candidatus Cloacimonetes bacterium]|nr:glycosyltransferase family 2 protein [Candidatus Cloacimonadota bacterium]